MTLNQQTYSTRSNATRALRRAIDSKQAAEGQYVVSQVDDRFQIVEQTDVAMLVTADGGDLGLVPNGNGNAEREAQKSADEEGVPVTIRHPESDAVLGEIRPGKAARKKARRAAAEASRAEVARVKKARTATQAMVDKKVNVERGPHEHRGPQGKALAILKLASRTGGASARELNELTGWRGAPWRWLFSNPRKTGVCDRWGFDFHTQRTDSGVRYFVTKPKTAQVGRMPVRSSCKVAT